MRLLSNITFLMAVLATAAGCGGKNPIQPPPPPPPAPQLELSCPAAMTREASSPQGTDVHFDAPTPTGGRAPYNVQCQPGSSSTFAIGETTVTCTATDADMKQASCGFGVTVRVSQTFPKTKFMAFGDSITLGTISLAPLVMLDGPETYPFKLEQMLRERYPAQTFLVTNRGKGGENTRNALLRAPGVLDEDKPEVMLLLDGVNASWLLPTSEQTSNLRGIIRAAQQRGADVIVATVMPVTPEWEADKHVGANAAIRALNPRIFQLAAEHHIAPVVDLFSLFDANMHLIGRDGLHPTAEGQTRIAEAFRDEIVRRYGSESKTSLSTSISTALRPMR